METNCLIKIKNIKPQSTKNAEERKKDIKNTYILKNEEKIKGKKYYCLMIYIQQEVQQMNA